MGTVVGGFLLPHDPLIHTAPQAPPADVRDRVTAAYRAVAERLAALDPTDVVIIGADHYVLFGPGCLPRYLIGTGDVSGPVERLPGLARAPLPDNRELARHIAEHGHRNRVDWAVAPVLTADHSIVIPYDLVVRASNARVVPVYLASGVEPLLSMTRAAEVGAAIRAAVEAYDRDVRVAVLGSGGISHWVGTPEMGRVNAEFDRTVLDLVARGDLAGLCALDDATVRAEGGNGAQEIRNFAAAMAAVGPCRGEILGYEAVPEWITGLGFAALTAHP
ncbi:hypothetical protein [Embleya sp. AB8]|uniref:DODA-type extradiol aromatic ring-opening family dioxygenase n=1 Tax=Embleya sp. AB8 TaxID=3156304 RepID=UPI003C73AF61